MRTLRNAWLGNISQCGRDWSRCAAVNGNAPEASVRPAPGGREYDLPAVRGPGDASQFLAIERELGCRSARSTSDEKFRRQRRHIPDEGDPLAIGRKERIPIPV